MRSTSAGRSAARWLIFLVGGGVATAAPGWGGGSARADFIYELTPTVGAGATDNALVTAMGQTHTGATFSTAGGSARIRYRGALVEHALGYHLTYTRFLIEDGPDVTSHNVAWVTSAQLSSLWRLQLGAAATLTRSSGVDPSNPAAVVPQAGMAGSLLYLATVANQSLSYTPTPRRMYSESLTVGHLRYLESMLASGMPVALPRTTLVTLALSGSRLVGRETLMLDVSASDMLTDFDSTAPVDPNRRGHTLFATALGGWKHELSPVWSTTVQAGPMVIARFDGNGVIAPAATATLAYAQVPWFAMLTVAQTPVANPYVGEATISDQVLARVAVPVMRSERVFVGGYGGYVYARVANGEAQLDRLYDSFIGGLSLTVRFPKLPLAAAATYSVLSQRGSALAGRGEVADVARQYVLINLRADLSWGPGTPPLFGGPL
jgi:hypothetical protein